LVPLTQVTFDGASGSAVSADGTKLACVVPDAGVVVMTADGAVLDTIGSGYEPCWCPDQDLVLVRQGSTLKVIDPETGEMVWTFSGDFDDGPAWSPLGHEIAAQGDPGIAVISYPGGELTTISCSDPDQTGCEGETPTWSPDGEWIAFEDGLEILKVPRTGGTAVEIVGDLNDVAYPAWSPDGRWIAFLQDSTAYDYAHIWVADARGMEYGLWQATSGEYFDYRPAWSPDSRVIYFTRREGGCTYGCDDAPNIWKVGFAPE
jgi:Tol biopolymer transport system component